MTRCHSAFAYSVLCLLVGGCAGLGDRVGGVDLPAGAPELRDVVGDLQRNDKAVRTFRAAGTFTVESPDLKARKKKFRAGSIQFRRPTDLFVRGNHKLTNMAIFKMMAVGNEFLMEFPTQKEASFYQIEAIELENVPFSVSPSEIAREMFLPEAWGDLGRRQVRLTGYDPAENSATLEVGPRQNPRRRVRVSLVDLENPQWVVVENVRLGVGGQVLAITQLSDYRLYPEESVYFPSRIEAYFPTEETRMLFELRGIRINIELDPEKFDIRRRARELGLLSDEAANARAVEGD